MESINLPKLIKWGGLALVAIIVLTLIWPFYSVPTGSRGVVTRFGAIVGIEAEGLTVLPPWEKLSIFSIRAETANVQNAEGATSDTQPVTTSLTVRYAIQPDKVSEVFEQYSHDGDLSSYVDTATHEIFKSVTAKYDAPDLISQRPKVSADIYDALTTKLAKYGARVVNIDMTGFAFSPTYMAAINDKVTQEQLRLAAENKLKTVEAEQKQKVAVAEAEANAVKATADGDAYARITNATAEAKAIQVQSQALAQSAQVLELRRITVEQTKAEKWDGKLPEAIYAGAPIPFLDVSKK
jgi:prohibitin 2